MPKAGPAKHYIDADGRHLGTFHDAVDDEGEVVAEVKVPEGAAQVASGPPGPGKLWDGAAWVDDPDYLPPPRSVTVTEFRDRFTKAERVRIMREATKPTGDEDVADFWMQVVTVGTVDLNSPVVDAGLKLLVTQGFLTEARKAEILS